LKPWDISVTPGTNLQRAAYGQTNWCGIYVLPLLLQYDKNLQGEVRTGVTNVCVLTLSEINPRASKAILREAPAKAQTQLYVRISGQGEESNMKNIVVALFVTAAGLTSASLALTSKSTTRATRPAVSASDFGLDPVPSLKPATAPIQLAGTPPPPGCPPFCPPPQCPPDCEPALHRAPVKTHKPIIKKTTGMAKRLHAAVSAGV
jgi:hypothetical protein